MTLFALIENPTQSSVGDSCVRNLFPHHACDACRQACPTQAISFEGNTTKLDSELCIRCGHCLFVCPVDALENLSTTRRQFCHSSLVAPFSSLAASVDELLMWHIQYGIRAVEIDIDAYPGWALAVAALNIRLKALDEPLWLLRTPATKSVSVFRRHLLRVKQDNVRSAAVKASQRLRRKAWKDVKEHQPLLDSVICVLCGACERVCQENAIQFAEKALCVNPSRCTGCNNCAIVCPTKAITISAEAGASLPMDFPFTREICTSCQRGYATFDDDGKQCPVCQRHQYGMRGR